ncbi:MAG: hypothetical protein IPN29_16750 [Saprospiraceae bacterium]|nr:hypothetical protein [Saprospiraceae bacterium]
MALWGKHEAYKHSDDEYAIGVGDEIHEIFKSYHDDILIVSDQEKSVSSTAGHALMDSNVYAATRYIQANDHITTLKGILSAGDADAFGKLAETEALTLACPHDVQRPLLHVDSTGDSICHPTPA